MARVNERPALIHIENSQTRIIEHPAIFSETPANQYAQLTAVFVEHRTESIGDFNPAALPDFADGMANVQRSAGHTIERFNSLKIIGHFKFP